MYTSESNERVKKAVTNITELDSIAINLCVYIYKDMYNETRGRLESYR